MIAAVGLLLTTIGGHDGVLAGIGNSGGGTVLHDRISELPNHMVLPSEGLLDARLMLLQEQGRTPTAEAGEPETLRLEDRWDLASLGGEGDTALEDVSVVTPAAHTDDVTAAICAYPWPQGCEYWIGIARCESTLGQDPWAYDDRNPYIGLFQVDVAHGYGREWLKDDANNTLAAWELSHEGTRTSPWPYCQW